MEGQRKVMQNTRCRDPNSKSLKQEDLWIPSRYCENPLKDIFTVFHFTEGKGK